MTRSFIQNKGLKDQTEQHQKVSNQHGQCVHHIVRVEKQDESMGYLMENKWIDFSQTKRGLFTYNAVRLLISVNFEDETREIVYDK